VATELNLICCRRVKGKKCGERLFFIGRSAAGDKFIFQCAGGHKKEYWIDWFKQRFGFSRATDGSIKLPDKCPVCGCLRTSADSRSDGPVMCGQCGANLAPDESGKLVEED